MKRLDHAGLERSPIVANSRMNRERGAVGVNSYEKELGLNPVDFLMEKRRVSGDASWLDLCCGVGRALLETAATFHKLNLCSHVTLHGVDLVDMFDAAPPEFDKLTLEVASLHDWNAERHYDLITCVHGLHYLGDKLAVIERAARWLTPNGLLLASLDLANFRRADGEPLGNKIVHQFRAHNLDYNRRRHLLSCQGARQLSFSYHYLGADDAAGPNYSGQEAVDSFYETAENA